MPLHLLLIAVSVWALHADACIPTAYISCYQTHIQGNNNPQSENFCNDIKTATAGYASCMQEAMEGCTGPQLWQLENSLNLTLAGFSEYDPHCKGQCGNVFARQQQLGACMQRMAGVSADTMCTTVQSVAECAWNAAKGCETLEVMYQTSLLPNVMSANEYFDCNIVVQGAPGSLPEGCDNIAHRMQDMNMCHRPFNTSGGASIICPAMQELASCAWEKARGCSLSEAGFRTQIQSSVDIYTRMYSCGAAHAEVNETANVTTQVQNVTAPTFTEDPTAVSCVRLQQCSLELAKQLGLQPDGGGVLAPGYQAKLEKLTPAAGLSRPGPLCQLFKGKIRIGPALECMQRESKQCLGVDPFDGLGESLQSRTEEGMLGSEVFQHNIVNQQLRLVGQNGSLNGTAWDLYMTYACHPGCGGSVLSNFTNQFSNCANPTLLEGKGTCGEYQNMVDCIVVLDDFNGCPLVQLILNGLEDYLALLMSKSGLKCKLDIDVSPPTIPPEFYNETRENSTNTITEKLSNTTTSERSNATREYSVTETDGVSPAPEAVANYEIKNANKSGPVITGGLLTGIGGNTAPALTVPFLVGALAALTHTAIALADL